MTYQTYVGIQAELTMNGIDRHLARGQKMDMENRVAEAHKLLKDWAIAKAPAVLQANTNSLIPLHSNKTPRHKCTCEETVTSQHLLKSICWLFTREQVAKEHGLRGAAHLAQYLNYHPRR